MKQRLTPVQAFRVDLLCDCHGYNGPNIMEKKKQHLTGLIEYECPVCCKKESLMEIFPRIEYKEINP